MAEFDTAFERLTRREQDLLPETLRCLLSRHREILNEVKNMMAGNYPEPSVQEIAWWVDPGYRGSGPAHFLQAIVPLMVKSEPKVVRAAFHALSPTDQQNLNRAIQAVIEEERPSFYEGFPQYDPGKQSFRGPHV